MRIIIWNQKKNYLYTNYSGKDDIFNASKSINKSDKFNSSAFYKFLSSGKTPDPDILIRSGGYKRISDFMLYRFLLLNFFYKKVMAKY